MEAQTQVRREKRQRIKAAQDGHVIVMANPDAWYTAEGGIQALLTMISDLESVLLSD